MSRQRAAELDLGAGEIVVSRIDVDALHDDLYMLAAAIEDADRDLDDAGTTVDEAELRRILDWVIDAARPLVGRSVVAARLADPH